MPSSSWPSLRERLAKFGLELHPEKTRLLEFGRFAAQNRRAPGRGKPETFNFLGFSHICGKTRKGTSSMLIRQTLRQRRQAKLRKVKAELHDPIPEQGVYLGAVVRGHVQYYGVPRNGEAIATFRRPLVVSGGEPSGDAARTDSKRGNVWNAFRPLAPSGPDLSPVSFRTTQATWRSYSRQEPSALVAPAGICAGGAGQPASLPRSQPLWCSC